MHRKELQNITKNISSKYESVKDSQTESESTTNQNFFQNGNSLYINNDNEKAKKNEPQKIETEHFYPSPQYMNPDDNINSDLELKDLASKASIFSIDSSKHLQELLNEDIIQAIDSPVPTPKNKKIETENLIEDNNDIITDEMLNSSNKNFFQFSLYNNDTKKENNINENDDIFESPIKAIIKKSLEENEKSDNKANDELNNDNIDNIIDTFYPLNLNSSKNEEEDLPQDKKENDNNKISVFKKDRGGGEIETKEEISIPKKITDDNNNINNEKDINKNNSINSDVRKNEKIVPQYAYFGKLQNFGYSNQGNINPLFQLHENKFDGNPYMLICQPMNKTIKPKKCFEKREGDWICSKCKNLNFSFRVKCNRCSITKEESEKGNLKPKSEIENSSDKENTIKENINKKEINQNDITIQKNKTANKNNYYSNQKIKNSKKEIFYPVLLIPFRTQYMFNYNEMKNGNNDNMKNNNGKEEKPEKNNMKIGDNIKYNN